MITTYTPPVRFSAWGNSPASSNAYASYTPAQALALIETLHSGLRQAELDSRSAKHDMFCVMPHEVTAQFEAAAMLVAQSAPVETCQALYNAIGAIDPKTYQGSPRLQNALSAKLGLPQVPEPPRPVAPAPTPYKPGSYQWE